METELDSTRTLIGEIQFANGNCASMVQSALGTSPEEIIKALHLPDNYEEVIIVFGWAGNFEGLLPDQQSRLIQLCTRGIARAALNAKALVIDGGTNAGVMRLIGKGIAERAVAADPSDLAKPGFKPALIGIAPRGMITFPGDTTVPTPVDENGQPMDPAPLDANHSHFVLVPGEKFGDESSTITAFASALLTWNKPAAPGKEPEAKLPNDRTALVVLAGGRVDGVTKTDILMAVRRRFPIIVLQNSGGLADELLLYKNKEKEDPDPDVAEILEDGNLHFFDGKKTVAALEQLIVRELGVNDTMQEAWRRFAAYDAKALEMQKSFDRVQPMILGLGALVAFFIAMRASLPVEYGTDGLAKIPFWMPTFPFLNDLKPFFVTDLGRFLFVNLPVSVTAFLFASDLRQAATLAIDRLLYTTVLVIPILSAGLLAYTGKFNQGARWVVYRSAAEGVRRAIYIYRTRSPQFRAKPGDLPQGMAQGQAEAQAEITREMELQRRVQFISSQLMQSDANAAGLPLYEGEIPPQPSKGKQYTSVKDDGMSSLTPARYVELRLEDQIRFFRKRTVRNANEYHKWQVRALIVGGLGTLLAAIGLQLWVTVTSAFATMCVAYLEYRQTRMTIVQYNQSATNLENVRLWWAALAPEEQAEEKNIRQLVEATEEVLAAEMTGWVQQMQEALGKLRVEPAKPPEGKTNGADNQGGANNRTNHQAGGNPPPTT